MRRSQTIGSIIAGLLCFLTGSLAFAQEVDYTQYFANLPGVNAGFTGVEDYLDMKLGYRQGWNGFGVKNNDVFLSAYGALGATSQSVVRKNSLRISNPGAFDQLSSNQQVRRRQGIGGMVTNRTVGPYTSVSVSGNYAYHLPISRKMSVSLGTRVAYGSQRIDYNSLTVRDPVNDVFYQQLIQSNPGNQNFVSIDFGSVLYSNHFYLGLSTTNLGVKNLSGDNQLSISNRRQYGMQTGGNLPLSGKWSLNSGVRLVYDDGVAMRWAVNSRFRYKELLYIGGSYSSVSMFSILLGLNVSNNFKINYAYDHYLSGASALNVNVHELVLGIAFSRLAPPSKLW